MFDEIKYLYKEFTWYRLVAWERIKQHIYNMWELYIILIFLSVIIFPPFVKMKVEQDKKKQEQSCTRN